MEGRPGNGDASSPTTANTILREISPDGRWLVYTADDDGKTINGVLNVATGETRPLTEDKFVYLDPAFHRTARGTTSPLV
jgi:hypothetical protein